MKVGIIGGGAAGMLAAITAAKEGAEVTIIEKNERVGKKILATGNGKCNLSNLEFGTNMYYCSNEEKLQKVFKVFSPWDTITFFENAGLMIKDKNGYLYPYSEQASAVLDILRMQLDKYKVTLYTSAEIKKVDYQEKKSCFVVKHKEGADPAAVVYDTIQAGIARNADIIICDTAGRLHNKKNLMDELAKIYRVIDKELPYSDRESLLVLDATTGQNAVNQAREFKNVAEITGIVLTKLDGTARGGVVLAIKNDLRVPVKFVGVGEQIDDLQPFSPSAFAEGLFEAEVKHEEEDEE